MQFAFEDHIGKDSLSIVEIDSYISLVLLLMAITFILFILYWRIFKNYRNKRKQNHINTVINFINNYLFTADTNQEVINRFKISFLKNNLTKRVAIKEIIVYIKNLKGETKRSLKSLFFQLDLQQIVIKDLYSSKWYKKARAIYVSANIELKIEEKYLLKLLNHKKVEVRLQAVLYYIITSKKYPLNFLKELKEPLTLWQQIYIEDALKSFKGQTPDFSKWLNHTENSVIIFSMKMIADYNQFENTAKLIPFIEYPNDAVKKQAIKTLSNLGSYEAIDILIDRFRVESNEIKIEILRFIKNLGHLNHLKELSPLAAMCDEEIKIEYLIIEQQIK